jgi:hypothetical protein
MADKIPQEKKADSSKIQDLPRKISPDDAEKVKGGRAGGDDDDLEELEVQR